MRPKMHIRLRIVRFSMMCYVFFFVDKCENTSNEGLLISKLMLHSICPIVYKRGIVALISLLGRKSINGGFRHLKPDFTHDFGVLNRI